MPSESDICKRVVEIRARERLSQASLAHAAGLTRNQLANVELCRTELKFWVGWKICKALNLNPAFLATGHPPERPFHDFDPEKAANRPISQGASFGAVCSSWLADALSVRAEGGADLESRGVSAQFIKAHESAIVSLAKTYIENLPKDQREFAFEHLCQAIRLEAFGAEAVRFHKAATQALAHQDEKANAQAEQLFGKGGLRNVLTDASTTFTSSGVKAQWPALKRKLQNATANAESRSRLMKFLKVDKTRISQWLTDSDSAREPGAETALRMLAWVEQQERAK
jgi:transcriptional regulator with XRE-family HTH domain